MAAPPRGANPPRASSRVAGTLPPSPAERLRGVLGRPGCAAVPACYDGITARLVERAGFEVSFVSGFGVSASRLAEPDAGVVSFDAMSDACRAACRAAPGLAMIGDGDTGFGGVLQARRMVEEYASAGLSAVSIEDQAFPKRCAMSNGVASVSREEALARLDAVLCARDDLRDAGGPELLVVGRTDCRGELGLEEALWRCQAFEDLGADVVYFEGPRSRDEMRELNRRTSVPTLLAQVERPGVEFVGVDEAAELGYSLALFGVTLLNASMTAVERALASMADGGHPADDQLQPFDSLTAAVGFPGLYESEERFDPARYKDRT